MEWDDTRRWRGLHRFRAFAGGYFWMPCPNCGLAFGGHERGALLDEAGQMTCAHPTCVDEVAAKNKAFWARRGMKVVGYVRNA